jgi:hypothetical protein
MFMPGTRELIMLVAFDDNSDGELAQAFAPRQAESQQAAIEAARLLSERHAGVAVWSRRNEPAIGETGAPVLVFSAGRVGDFD